MNNDNNLEKLKKQLYRQNRSFLERRERDTLRPETNGLVPDKWQRPNSRSSEKIRKIRPMKVIVYLLILFLTGLLGFASYLWYAGINVVSSENVFIDVAGPVYVDGGQVASFNFIVKNGNTAALELADLVLDFPANSFSAEGDQITRQRISIGKIEAGETINKPSSVVFFGLENEEKNISAILEYRLAGSNAIFAKNIDYTVRITKTPIGLSLSIPSEAVSNQEISVKIEAVSNSESVAKKLRLEMKYPSGFKFISAAPEPGEGENIWSLGDIGPSQKISIIIRGIIEGQNMEERTFVASAGALDESGVLRVYGTASEKLTLKKTPLNLSVLVNGQNEDKNIVYSGDSARIDVKWVNNLSDYVRNAQIELEIIGGAHDERSISISKGGFYRTSDKKIIWNSSSLGDLASIPSGESGAAKLSFLIKDPLPIKSINDKNFSVSINAKIFGFGTSDQFENKEVSDSVVKKISVASRLQPAGRSVYHSGPFKNSGPLPPKVGAETTYTITWSLANNSNDFSDVKIMASLPPYVSWTNQVSPSGSNIKFDEKNLSLVWEAGGIPAGTGIIMQAKEISFQVSFAPNLTQVGDSPVLVNGARVEGRDNFIGQVLRAEIPSLSINLSGDSQSKQSDYKVAE